MKRSGYHWRKRQKQLHSIMTKLKEKGYNLEMTPEVYNAKGEFYNYDFGEGYNTLVKVSKAVVKFLQG